MKKVFHTSPHSAKSTHSSELLNIYNYNQTKKSNLVKCTSSKAEKHANLFQLVDSDTEYIKQLQEIYSYYTVGMQTSHQVCKPAYLVLV